MSPGTAFLATVLVAYLLGVGISAAAIVIVNFPVEADNVLTLPNGGEFVPFGKAPSVEHAMLAPAFAAGVAGSFLHAAQSLATYLGNGVFKASWTAWYFLRPWIGGVLGFAIFFVIRAGLIGGSGVQSVNPYGLIAVALLGGWFSKTTTDKLQEVFESSERVVLRLGAPPTAGTSVKLRIKNPEGVEPL